ncbi:conserved hypothetical protein [Ricinus communis]|uniref:PdxS/SNZ N-terminal domain-containing protein n=1 Tax=Ricinus communis TaxID=3988 RepID=B9RQP0_RICCO|nr:conserved hypothetical protein [Ricinus communis]
MLGFAEKLQGGVIVKVTNVEQAKIAEEAGASCIVIHHGKFHKPDPSLVWKFKLIVPVMARELLEALTMKMEGVRGFKDKHSGGST